MENRIAGGNQFGIEGINNNKIKKYPIASVKKSKQYPE
jgi:hypothetical protein